MLYVFLFPVAFIALALAIYNIDSSFYHLLFGILEGGVFEWVQFACYLFAAIISAICVIKNKHDKASFVNILLLLFSIATFFIALEEISYGQHIFKWDTPAHLQQINSQRETNLHNLTIVMENGLQIKAFVLIGLCGAFSWILRANSEDSLHWRDILFVNRYLALYFLPVSIFYMNIILFGMKYNDHQELFETVLSFGFLMVAIFNFNTVNRHLKRVKRT